MQGLAFSYKNEYVLIDLINKSGKSVYKAKTPKSDEIFALKVFPYNNKEVSHEYLHEARFTDLAHPNVIQVIEKNSRKKYLIRGQNILVSYLVFEYAPKGDFHSLFAERRVDFDEILARTYFHQLIEGIEYLHNKGIAHLDLKPANLVLSNDYTLKICDFGLAWEEGDEEILSEGTEYYRAPELINDTCKLPKQADIFSAGLLLFMFKCNGRLAQREDKEYRGYKLFELMQKNLDAFWEAQCKLQNKSPHFFDPAFRNLFERMTASNPEERISISDIKSHEWFKGPTYTKDEVVKIMSSSQSVDKKSQE